MPWWGWLLVAAGVAGLLMFAFRPQLRYLIRVAKAISSDERLPRPLRWGLKVALAIKVVPVPDLGIDEVLSVVIGILLVTVYRPTLRAILDETRREHAAAREISLVERSG